MDKFFILTFVMTLIILLIVTGNLIHFILRKFVSKKTSFEKMGKTTKVQVIYHLREAIAELSKTKTGAIITIENIDSLDNLRTDGLEIEANISSALLISIFNKQSPLHDGAVIIKESKITYASTYFKITTKSINNRYGARHRAALGISEQCDAITIVVSEQNGAITIAKAGKFFPINRDQIQENLIKHLN